MLVVGIDQSTGAKSNIGFSVIDLDSMTIIIAKEFQASREKDLRKRLKLVCAHLASEFKKLEEQQIDYAIFTEDYFMQGIGGRSLQRLNGAMMVISPSQRMFEFVSNMQVKQYISGSGKGDKKEVALGLIKFFHSNQESVDIINQLMVSSRYDALDAIAIALTGYEKYVQKSVFQKPTKKR